MQDFQPLIIPDREGIPRPLPVPDGARVGWPWTGPCADAGPVPAGGWPRITLITPSYNQAEFIEETLRSVVLQGYPDLEWIIHDGGSSDGSMDLIRRYEPWASSVRSQRDRGQSDAINRGFERASGSLVGWLNSDDVLLPGALHRLARRFAEHPEAVMIAGVGIDTDAGSRAIGRFVATSGERTRLALWNAPGGSVICQPASMMRRSVFEKTGLLDESLHNALDVDLWLRISAIGPIVTVPDELATNRIHAGAKTSRLVFPRIIEHTSVILRNRLPVEARDYFLHNVAEMQAALGYDDRLVAGIPWRRLAGGLVGKFLRRIRAR